MLKSFNMHSSGWNMKILIIFYTFGMGTMIGDLQMRMVGRLGRKFVKFLKLFYNATKRFSGSLYVTSNAFFDEIYMIKRRIDLFSRSKDHFFVLNGKNNEREV